MYVCVYLSLYIYNIYIYISFLFYLSLYISLSIYLSLPIYIYIYILRRGSCKPANPSRSKRLGPTRLRIGMYGLYIYIYMHIYIYICVCMYIYIYIYIHIKSFFRRRRRTHTLCRALLDWSRGSTWILGPRSPLARLRGTSYAQSTY